MSALQRTLRAGRRTLAGALLALVALAGLGGAAPDPLVDDGIDAETSSGDDPTVRVVLIWTGIVYVPIVIVDP